MNWKQTLVVAAAFLLGGIVMAGAQDPDVAPPRDSDVEPAQNWSAGTGSERGCRTGRRTSTRVVGIRNQSLREWGRERNDCFACISNQQRRPSVGLHSGGPRVRNAYRKYSMLSLQTDRNPVTAP